MTETSVDPEVGNSMTGCKSVKKILDNEHLFKDFYFFLFVSTTRLKIAYGDRLAPRALVSPMVSNSDFSFANRFLLAPG